MGRRPKAAAPKATGVVPIAAAFAAAAPKAKGKPKSESKAKAKSVPKAKPGPKACLMKVTTEELKAESKDYKALTPAK